MTDNTASIRLVGPRTDVITARPMDLTFTVPFKFDDVDPAERFLATGTPSYWSTEFFDEFDGLINFVIATNRPGGSYHSTHHLIGVAWIAFMLAKAGGGEIWPPLIYAALLHDYNHAASYDDAVNIANTISSVKESGALDVIYPKWRDETLRLIGDTIWPLPEGHHIDLPAGLLRDADQIYATYFLTRELSERLFEELGPRFGVSDYGQWLKRNIDYGMSLSGTFETVAGEKMFKSALPGAIRLQIDELVRHTRRQCGAST